jgi:pimeloyl-ACP methyl ester carboxylesterase
MMQLHRIPVEGELSVEVVEAAGGGDEKRPVLCLHGLTRNHRDFECLFPLLTGRGHRVFAANMRGRAGSSHDPNPENYAVPTYAHDVRLVLDHFGLDRVILIGTSMGGLISMMFANTEPDRIAAIIMNDIGPVIEQSGLDRIAGYVGGDRAVSTWAQAADIAQAINGDAFPLEANNRSFWIDFAQRLFAERGDEIVLDYDPAISANVKAGNVAPPAMWELYEAVKAYPLLLVRGALSDLLSSATAQRMIAEHPHATLVQVPDIGHAPLLDEPPVLSALEIFLEGLDA